MAQKQRLSMSKLGISTIQLATGTGATCSQLKNENSA